MSQVQIYQFLKENPEEDFSSKQIIEQTGISKNTVVRNLRKLKKFDMITVLNEETRCPRYQHKCKASKADL